MHVHVCVLVGSSRGRTQRGVRGTATRLCGAVLPVRGRAVPCAAAAAPPCHAHCGIRRLCQSRPTARGRARLRRHARLNPKPQTPLPHTGGETNEERTWIHRQWRRLDAAFLQPLFGCGGHAGAGGRGRV